MNETFINDVVQGMTPFLDNAQLEELQYVLQQTLHGKSIVQAGPPDPLAQKFENQRLLELFIAAKRVEGSLHRYLRDLQCYAAESIFAGGANYCGFPLLRRCDAQEP